MGARAWSGPRAFELTGKPAGLRPPQALVPPPFRAWARDRELPHREGATFRARWRRGEVFDAAPGAPSAGDGTA